MCIHGNIILLIVWCNIKRNIAAAAERERESNIAGIKLGESVKVTDSKNCPI